MGKELNDSLLLSSSFIIIGNSHSSMGNNNLATYYYFKGLEIEERLKEQNNIQWYFNNIGNVFSNQKNYSKALEYTNKARIIVEKGQETNKKFLDLIYNNIGWIYMLNGNYDSASYALNKSLQIAEKLNNKYVISICLDNLSQLAIKEKKYEVAYNYSRKSYELSKEQGLKEQTTASLITMGTVKMQSNDFNSSEIILLEGLKLSRTIKSYQLTSDAAYQLAILYQKKSNFKQAYDYFKIYSEVKDSLLNKENSKVLTEMNTKYTTEKKEKEIELLKKNEKIQNLELSERENELNKQRTISVGFFSGFVLLVIAAILLLNSYRIKKKANHKLQLAYNVIEEKNSMIEKANTLITDSITYAKRIQDAILPANKDLVHIFSSDFFIIYNPSQIVSGVFYWCSKKEDKIIIAVADCTGHGVPGAFMSMIGNTLLHEIVKEHNITDTKKIAQLLDEKIIAALRQKGSSKKYDGMDISICCIDYSNKKIQFTGANHFMYVYDEQLKKIKGDSYSIGGSQHQEQKLFTSQSIDIRKDTAIYLLTAGYYAQQGELSNTTFSSEKLEQLLNEIHSEEMSNQKTILENAFNNWKGNLKQRDDILMMGIRFPF